MAEIEKQIDANATQVSSFFRVGLFLIGLLGFFVRFAGIFFGFPQQLDPDEMIAVTAAHNMLSGDPFLDPQWYGWPASTLIALLALAYAAIAFGGLLLGHFESLSDFGAIFYTDPSLLFLTGRLITTIAGTLCIIATYSLAKRFMGGKWALAAAAIVAFSPGMVSFSSLVRMDMFQILFMLLVVISTLNAVDKPNKYLHYFALAGFFLGLAVTSKYPGIIAVLAIIYGILITPDLTTRERLFALSIAGLASLIAAFASGPYLFLNFSAVWDDVVREARDYHLSASSPGFFTAAWNYLETAIPSLTHISIAVLGYVGLIILAYRRGKEAIVSLLFVAYVLFISSLSLWWTRWALPVLPFLAIAFAFAMQTLSSRIPEGALSEKSKSIASVALLTPFVVAQLYTTIPSVRAKLLNQDTRVSALEWVEENIPRNSRILIETYAPQLSTRDYNILIARSGRIKEWKTISKYVRPPGYFGNIGENLARLNQEQLVKALSDNDIQYVITSNFYDRYKRDNSKRGDAPLAVYEKIFSLTREIQEFHRSNYGRGPSLKILRFD